MHEKIQGGLSEIEQDVFDEISAGFGDMSLRSQRATLESLETRQLQYLADEGVIRRLIRHMPIRQGHRRIAVARRFTPPDEDGMRHEVGYLAIAYTKQNTSRVISKQFRVPVFVMDQDHDPVPQRDFGFNEALAVMDCIDEKLALKDEGVLSALSHTLDTLYATHVDVSLNE